MATLAVTSNPHNPLAPSWDEAIVPTLRKRLENESRMLTQRLSTISISTDDAKQQQQPQPRPPEETNNNTPSNPSSSRRTQNGTRSHTPTQRPSAIPRPSYSRTNNEHINTSATRSNTSILAEPLPSNGHHAISVAPTRKRTHSTPFPFEPPPDSTRSSSSDGKQLSSSANFVSGAAKSSGGRTTPTPSRIPTVPSRIRSGSQSSQGLNTLGKSVGAKIAPLEPNSTHVPGESALTLTSATVQPSASTSSARQRVSEDHQGYRVNNKHIHPGIEEKVNERFSSDEERPFQHWYRGDVSRNGGVGEYRVGKREEMLDIASFGHKPVSKILRPGTQDSRGLPSTFNDRNSRKRAESVSSVERTSLHMEAPDETILGRILDEVPLDDVELNSLRIRRRRQSVASIERTSLYVTTPDVVETSTGIPSSAIQSNTITSSQNVIPSSEFKTNVPGAPMTQSKLLHPRPRNTSNSQHESKASTSTTSSLPETIASRNGKHTRGRTQSPVERSKTPQKKADQKRSKSVSNAVLPSDSPDNKDFSGLRDAIPDTRTPIPIDGNWDEMVLPTVARRMGIEYETKEPVLSKSPETLVIPAPGTFGFDYSKYRPWRQSEECIPISEFGERSPSPPQMDPGERELTPQYMQAASESEKSPQHTSEIPIEKPPEAIPQMRPRRDTLPPFAQYAQAPSLRERQHMPQVIMPQLDTETTPQMSMYVEEGEDSHCCKCIIM